MDICEVSFETTLTTRVPQLLFRFSTGYQPSSLNGTFRRLMRDTGLLKNEDGQNRTLYSLRHTYATLALLEGGTDKNRQCESADGFFFWCFRKKHTSRKSRFKKRLFDGQTDKDQLRVSR